MSDIRPLTPGEAEDSLANRLSGMADRVRQIPTRFGARPYRTFLVWTRWGGKMRGDGNEEVTNELELLPTPEVQSLDAVTFSAFHAGNLPVGSIRLMGVSVRLYSYDMLVGRLIPKCVDPDSGRVEVAAAYEHLPQPLDFYYEVREDGRQLPLSVDCRPERRRFQLFSWPFKKAEDVEWTLMLEKASGDRTRAGLPQLSERGPQEGT